MINQLEQWDKSLFKLINGAHNDLFDFLMPWVSDKWIWIPLYALLIYMMVKHEKGNLLVTFIGIGLLILISDQVALRDIKTLRR